MFSVETENSVNKQENALGKMQLIKILEKLFNLIQSVVLTEILELATNWKKEIWDCGTWIKTSIYALKFFLGDLEFAQTNVRQRIVQDLMGD